MAQTKGILIRTYDQDAPRLRFALSSIRKFVSNVDSVTVVCQCSSEPVVAAVVREFSFVTLKICPPSANDYIGQQITKLLAHDYVNEDLIYHIDSDCMFRANTDLSYFLQDSKPVLQHRSYESLYRLGVFIPWQESTSKFLRRQVDLEFMCGFPFVYPRQLTLDLRKHFVEINGYDYDRLEQNIVPPNNLSEYNIIGAFSYAHGNKYNYHQGYSPAYDTRVNQHCTTNRDIREIHSGEFSNMKALLGD